MMHRSSSHAACPAASPRAQRAAAPNLRACVARSGNVMREVLSSSQRSKLDTSDDRSFYQFPRLVKHVDDSFLSQVTELYRQRIPPGGVVLDLCSSWVSHLPPEVSYSRVVGHGMNAAELARNPRLSDFFVRNLNTDPDGWMLADGACDAVVCCVSVQYLQEPERVFAEIYRKLKPGGVCIMTFSNRMFFTKAVEAWRETTDYGRCQLVRSYFQSVAGFTAPEILKSVTPDKASGNGSGGAQPSVGDFVKQLLQKVLGGSTKDPFFAVVAYRDFKP